MSWGWSRPGIDSFSSRSLYHFCASCRPKTALTAIQADATAVIPSWSLCELAISESHDDIARPPGGVVNFPLYPGYTVGESSGFQRRKTYERSLVEEKVHFWSKWRRNVWLNLAHFRVRFYKCQLDHTRPLLFYLLAQPLRSHPSILGVLPTKSAVV